LENYPKISPENKLTFFTASIKVQQLIFVILLLICVSGLISPPVALLLGLVAANFTGNPFYGLMLKRSIITSILSRRFFGMNVNSALSAGKRV
jgi:hypothetical protein